MSINPSLLGDTADWMSSYLLTYDALAFHAYLETLIESNTVNEAGNARHNQSSWMLTDAAHIMFEFAKRRCYTISAAREPAPRAYDIDDEDAWDALDEAEGLSGRRRQEVKEPQAKRPFWLPKNMHPVLEELPKWSLVSAALQEIEEEMIRREPKMTFREHISDVSPLFLTQTCGRRRSRDKHGADHDVVTANVTAPERVPILDGS